MEQFNVKLDENWVTPAAMAAEVGVDRSTVGKWISRNQIDYTVLAGALVRRHLVDRRTAPPSFIKGRPRNTAKKAN